MRVSKRIFFYYSLNGKKTLLCTIKGSYYIAFYYCFVNTNLCKVELLPAQILLRDNIRNGLMSFRKNKTFSIKHGEESFLFLPVSQSYNFIIIQ